MNFIGNIFRPPAEHNSILLQVTVGCSHNKCRFCGMYKDKSRFQIKSDEVITGDLKYAAEHYRKKKRLFLCDGDALIIPQERLLNILKMINEHLPWVVRIGTYANAKSLKRKSLDELMELKKHRLGIVYFGLESGDDETLKNMIKGSDVKTQIEQAKKVKSASMKLSVTVLLGLAGKRRSSIHAVETGRALSEINPNYVGALSLMTVEEVPLYSDIMEGKFEVPSPHEILKELKLMMENTTLSPGIFSANHASNYLPLQVRFPSEKEDALKMIDEALLGNIELKPEYLRGL